SRPASSATTASSIAGAASVSGGASRLSNRMRRISFVLKVVTGIGAVERFVAEGKIGDDVALDGGFQERPLEPGRVAQMTAPHATILQANPGQHVTAEAFDKPQAFSRSRRGIDLGEEGAGGQVPNDLLDEAQALLHLTDAQPDAGIHIAVPEHQNVEFEPV